MKRTKWTRASALLFTLALALVMIGLPATALANVTGLSFTVASPQHVLVGGTVTLTAVPTQTGTTTGTVVYNWTNNTSSIIGLSATSGNPVTVTGLIANTGSISVNAKDDGDTAGSLAGTTQPYSIIVDPMTVSLSASTIAIGGTSNATANASTYTGTITGWTSSNNSVATVDSSTGVVTGVSSGTANIIATNDPAGTAAPNQTAYATVTVVAPTVTLNPPSQTLTTGSTPTTLTLSVTNGGTVIPTGATVTWGNSDPTIGTLSGATTVNGSGVATVNFTSSTAATNGTTTITAIVGGITRTATVTVSTVKHLDLVGPASLDKTTRTGNYTVYLRNPDNTIYSDSTSTVHWSWSSSYLSLTSDSINSNRAHMHGGEAHIQLYAKYNTPSGGTKLYVWLNDDTGGKVYHTITISGLSSLPQTGQDMTLVYVFGALSAALLAAAGVWYGIRKKNSVA